MRTLRLSLMGAVMLMPLGGAVVAQDAAEVNAGFTMNVTAEEWGFEGEDLVHRLQVEASDPRLNGTWSRVQNCLEDVRPPSLTVCVGSVRVENEGGTWVGRFENAGGGVQPRWIEWTMLDGQGDYAGLTAFIYSSDEMDSDRELSGAGHIVATLPMPELPPAE
jgi:hypothetical protein